MSGIMVFAGRPIVGLFIRETETGAAEMIGVGYSYLCVLALGVSTAVLPLFAQGVYSGHGRFCNADAVQFYAGLYESDVCPVSDASDRA